jgi:hypothetical protein
LVNATSGGIGLRAQNPGTYVNISTSVIFDSINNGIAMRVWLGATVYDGDLTWRISGTTSYSTSGGIDVSFGGVFNAANITAVSGTATGKKINMVSGGTVIMATNSVGWNNPNAWPGTTDSYTIGAGCLYGGYSASVAFSFAGKPAASAMLLVSVPYPMYVASALAGSTAFANTASTGTPVFTLNKVTAAGTTTAIGTITGVAGAKSFTFVSASGATLAAGDNLSIVAPATQDATTADMSISILGMRG